MKISSKSQTLASALILLLCWCTIATAQTAEEQLTGYQLLAVSAVDNAAVIKNTTGELLTLQKGERFPGLDLRITQIQKDRVYARETVSPGDTLIIFKTQVGTPSQVKRIHTRLPEEEGAATIVNVQPSVKN